MLFDNNKALKYHRQRHARAHARANAGKQHASSDLYARQRSLPTGALTSGTGCWRCRSFRRRSFRRPGADGWVSPSSGRIGTHPIPAYITFHLPIVKRLSPKLGYRRRRMQSAVKQAESPSARAWRPARRGGRPAPRGRGAVRWGLVNQYILQQ